MFVSLSQLRGSMKYCSPAEEIIIQFFPSKAENLSVFQLYEPLA